MKKSFQAELRSKIFLVMMFGAVVSSSQNLSASHQSALNFSFEREENRLLRPIVIPNLTGLSEDFFTSTSQSGIKKNEKLSEVFLEKATEVTNRDEESSQDSVVRVPLINETPKSKGNVSKFSSRYSSKPEVYGAIIQDNKEGLHTRDIKKEKETKRKEPSKNIKEGPRVTSLFKIAENESDILPDNTVYHGNPDNAPFLGREKDQKKQTSDTDDHADIKETEPTGGEPLLELQISPSEDPLISRYSDEEEPENGETVPHEDIATKEHEDKDTRRADYDGDSKNYHSIQTPLHKIKFMGPHDFKDDPESSRMRTRPINPTERNHARYEWPYFKSQVKAEAEKDNEISTDGNESEDKDKKDSEEWQNDRTRMSSKVSDLERAVEKDEAKFGNASNQNQKYNVIHEKNRHLENQKALIAEEEKDHRRPLFKILSHNSKNKSELSFGDRTTGKTNKQEKELWAPKLTSTESSSKLLKNDAKINNLESTNFNISKELEPGFQGLNFLNSAILSKNIQKQKQPKNSERSKELSKNIFIQELENKEMIDHKNLYERKGKELVGGAEMGSQSFNHLEESDEMYNQILANIQSVFGLRTQPLKSRKDNKDPELQQEKNNSLTWSTALLQRTKSGREVPESSSI